MKQLVDFYKIKQFFDVRREEHTQKFVDYKYDYKKEVTIDDVIYEAKAVKELNALGDKIETFVPSMDELRKVYNALKNLSSLDVKAVAFDYKDEIKAIADFLGIDINDFKQDDEE